MKQTSSHPGLVDLHVNGLTVPVPGGVETVNFSAPDLTLAQVRRATESFVSAGTAAFLATLMTSTPETIVRNVSLLSQAMQEPWGKPILGIHLEGPFFSRECRGAHPAELIQEEGDIGLFRRFFEAADGAVVMTTVSPAIKGAPKFISQITKEMGVVVSIGHHNADVSQIEEAFEAGATGVTHAGNAWSKSPPRNGRKNCDVLAQLLNEKAYVMVIPDGVHVDATFIKYVSMAVKPSRLVWVSDCSPFAGAPEGFYPWSTGETVEVRKNEAGAVRTYPLTGSYLLLAECLDVLRGLGVVPKSRVLAGAIQNPLSLVREPLERLHRFPDLGTL